MMDSGPAGTRDAQTARADLVMCEPLWNPQPPFSDDAPALCHSIDESSYPRCGEHRECRLGNDIYRCMPTADDAVQILINAQDFGNGHVGFRGTPATTWLSYHALLAEPNAQERFQEVFDAADLPGKVFAVCGLWRSDPALARRFRDTISGERTLPVQEGCVGTPVSAEIGLGPRGSSPQSAGNGLSQRLQAASRVEVQFAELGRWEEAVAVSSDVLSGAIGPPTWLDHANDDFRVSGIENLSWFHFRRAFGLHRLEESQRALVAYQTFLRDPRFETESEITQQLRVDAAINAGIIAEKLGEHDVAVELFRRVPRDHEAHDDARYRAAVNLTHAGRHAASLRALRTLQTELGSPQGTPADAELLAVVLWRTARVAEAAGNRGRRDRALRALLMLLASRSTGPDAVDLGPQIQAVLDGQQSAETLPDPVRDVRLGN